MENNEIKLMFESWLLLDKDHITPFEYFEFVQYSPCCEQRQDIYHNLDDKEVKQLTINH